MNSQPTIQTENIISTAELKTIWW